MLIYLLLAIALLVALVGSIGLMSTMSINVVERTREIGVTASNVVGVFIMECVLVGVLSWLLAVPLSVPGVYALSSVVGEAIVQIPLEFTCSVSGALLWLLIVVALSALLATKVSVRESLAYE